MTRRGWTLFAAMAVIWGVPYFFIRVAVKELAPAVVVFGRSSIAAIGLLILARRAGAIRPALQHWKPIVAFAIIEMAIPWILLSHAEKYLTSGLTALIISSVPVVGSIIAFVLGERFALRPIRVVGIVLGLTGVGLLVGRDLSSDSPPPWWSVAEVLVVVVCYATAPFIADRRLRDVPSMGVISISLALVAVIYGPIAAFSLPDHAPRANAVWSVIALAVICTGLAFVVFFRLIAEVGAARAGLITFANPVVAVALGAIFLDETITFATVIGFALVLTGCLFATRSTTQIDETTAVGDMTLLATETLATETLATETLATETLATETT